MSLEHGQKRQGLKQPGRRKGLRQQKISAPGVEVWLQLYLDMVMNHRRVALHVERKEERDEFANDGSMMQGGWVAPLCVPGGIVFCYESITCS